MTASPPKMPAGKSQGHVFQPLMAKVAKASRLTIAKTAIQTCDWKRPVSPARSKSARTPAPIKMTPQKIPDLFIVMGTSFLSDASIEVSRVPCPRRRCSFPLVKWTGVEQGRIWTYLNQTSPFSNDFIH